MPKDQAKEELNNGKIDTNSVIVGVGEKNEVFDFLEYIDMSTHPSAIKIKNLRQYLSDEELLTFYSNVIGNGVTEKTLESSLEGFFSTLATYISELPNGIVIDLTTGLVDRKKSDKKILEDRINSKEPFGGEPEKDLIEELKEMDVINLLFDELGENEVFVDNYNFSDFEIGEIYKVYNDFMGKNKNDLNLSTEAINIYNKINERISANRIYEEKPELLEACYLKFHILANTYKDDRHMKDLLNERYRELIKKYPELGEASLPILDENGKLIPDQVRQMYGYITDKKTMITLGYFDRFNGMDANQISKLPKEERNKILMCAFSSLRYRDSSDMDYSGLARDGKNIIETLCPDLDLNNPKELAEFLKNEMEFEGDLTDFSLDTVSKFFDYRLKKVTEKNIMTQEQTKKNDDVHVDLDSLDFEYAKRKSYQLVMKNYFVGSEINFSEEEVKQYNTLYKNVTVNSWLQNKKNVMKLRYAALLDVREEYRKNPINTYVEKDLEVIEKEIKEFEETYGKIDITTEEGEVSLEDYKRDFAIAGLTRYLTKDAADWSEGVNYDDLDNSHKKGYIKRILVALNNKEKGEPYIEKIALRRLELMNSEGREFLRKNENGELEINKELLLQEYQEMFGDKYKYSSFEELMQSIKLREKEYVLEKLEEYSNLPPEAFKNLKDKSDIDASMDEIEKIKYLSNQKRIKRIVKNFNIKNDKEIIDNSVYESDMHLFEICKLQRELRDPKNVEHTQMYTIKLAEIKAFYMKHPKYRDKKLPILNEDGTLNSDEIKKMDQFSEAYQRIVIFEHLDKFKNGKKNIEELPKKDREHLLLCAFAGLKYEKSDDEDLRNLAKRCANLIGESYPQLDFEDEKKLAVFFKEKMGFAGKIEKISLDDIIEMTNQELKEATENYIEQDENSYVDKDIDFSALDLDSGKRKIYTSTMKNYFVGSKINFTEKDEEKYNEFYQHATVESWIENKENAIKLRYVALTTIRDEYKKNPVGTYTEKKLAEIEKAIKEFEDQYGKIDLTEKKGDVSFEKYREDFINAGVTKFLTRDASDWSDGIDYAELDDKHKKSYIRNILVVLENKDNPSYLTKIALRRLELMNSEGKEFVKFNEKGEYKINEELILEEYKSMSDYKYASYEELAQSSRLRKNEYLVKKLEEYTYLDDKAFLKLDSKKNYKKSMEEIEKARYISNQKRIHGMLNTPEASKEEKITDSDMFSALENGNLVEESLEMRTGEATRKRTDFEQRNQNDQEDAGSNNDNVESERKPSIEVETIDTSATQNKTPKFIDRVKRVFNDIKGRFNKIFKGEEQLQIDAPKEEKPSTTIENKKVGYDINTQFDIDHSLTNSGKNRDGKTQEEQDLEIDEI